MNHVSRRRLLKSGAAAGLLAAFGAQAASLPRQGGVLRYALPGARDWQDLRNTGVFANAVRSGAIYDGLVELAPDGTLAAALAVTWTCDAAARVWSLELREGAQFHNGRTVDAADVVASLRSHFGRSGPAGLRVAIGPGSRVTAQGSSKVRISLGTGNPDLPLLLSDPRVAIAPRDEISAGRYLGAGSGPYRLVDVRYDGSVRLEQVEGHYRAGHSNWFDRVEFLPVQSAEARSAAVQFGRADAALLPANFCSDRHPRVDRQIVHPPIRIGFRALNPDIPARQFFEAAEGQGTSLRVAMGDVPKEPEVILALGTEAGRRGLSVDFQHGPRSRGTDLEAFCLPLGAGTDAETCPAWDLKTGAQLLYTSRLSDAAQAADCAPWALARRWWYA
ncbi:MAG: ABC transporter substrate-binding protein [Pseudomonadota bacterium]